MKSDSTWNAVQDIPKASGKAYYCAYLYALKLIYNTKSLLSINFEKSEMRIFG